MKNIRKPSIGQPWVQGNAGRDFGEKTKCRGHGRRGFGKNSCAQERNVYGQIKNQRPRGKRKQGRSRSFWEVLSSKEKKSEIESFNQMPRTLAGLGGRGGKGRKENRISLKKNIEKKKRGGGKRRFGGDMK